MGDGPTEAGTSRARLIQTVEAALTRLDAASAVTPSYPRFPYYRQAGFARLDPPAV